LGRAVRRKTVVHPSGRERGSITEGQRERRVRVPTTKEESRGRGRLRVRKGSKRRRMAKLWDPYWIPRGAVVTSEGG